MKTFKITLSILIMSMTSVASAEKLCTKVMDKIRASKKMGTSTDSNVQLAALHVKHRETNGEKEKYSKPIENGGIIVGNSEIIIKKAKSKSVQNSAYSIDVNESYEMSDTPVADPNDKNRKSWSMLESETITLDENCGILKVEDLGRHLSYSNELCEKINSAKDKSEADELKKEHKLSDSNYLLLKDLCSLWKGYFRPSKSLPNQDHLSAPVVPDATTVKKMIVIEAPKAPTPVETNEAR